MKVLKSFNTLIRIAKISRLRSLAWNCDFIELFMIFVRTNTASVITSEGCLDEEPILIMEFKSSGTFKMWSIISGTPSAKFERAHNACFRIAFSYLYVF